jgi:hypothetical protein
VVTAHTSGVEDEKVIGNPAEDEAEITDPAPP